MTIELIDSTESIKVPTQLFHKKLVQSFIPDLWNEKKGLGISTLNGITSAIQANCLFREVVYQWPQRKEESIANLIRKTFWTRFWLHLRRFISLVSFLFGLNITVWRFFSSSLLSFSTVDATPNGKVNCVHICTWIKFTVQN